MGERQAPIPSASCPSCCSSPALQLSCLDIITPHVAEGQEFMLPRPPSLSCSAAFRNRHVPQSPSCPAARCPFTAKGGAPGWVRGALLQHLPEPKLKAQTLSMKLTAKPFATGVARSLLEPTHPQSHPHLTPPQQDQSSAASLL